jgi:hypothetical protein
MRSSRAVLASVLRLFVHSLTRFVVTSHAPCPVSDPTDSLCLVTQANPDTRPPRPCPQMAEALRVFHCDNCHRVVPVQLCKRNDNGNAGRAFARCDLVHPEPGRPPCKFFRWASPRNSPSNSPNIAAATPMTDLPAGDVISAASHQLATSTAKPTCKSASCVSTRINPACHHQQCCKHCIVHGGCPAKNHEAAVTQPTANASDGAVLAIAPPSVTQPTANASNGAVPGIAPLWILDPPASASATRVAPHHASQMLLTMNTANASDGAVLGIAPLWILDPPASASATRVAPHRASRTLLTVNATQMSTAPMGAGLRAGPRYASQMPPVFTEQIAKEQELHEKRRTLDKERLAQSQSMKN